MANLYIADKSVLNISHEHMFIVYEDDNGHYFVLRGTTEDQKKPDSFANPLNYGRLKLEIGLPLPIAIRFSSNQMTSVASKVTNSRRAKPIHGYL